MPILPFRAERVTSSRPSGAVPQRAEEPSVLVCGTLQSRLNMIAASRSKFSVPDETIAGWDELSSLLDSHSTSVVVLTREVLERLASDTFKSETAELHPTPGVRSLSAGHLELVRLVAKGLRNAEIERVTGIKARTVRAHLSELYRQFDVTNRTELIGTLLEMVPLTNLLAASEEDADDDSLS